MDVENCEIKLQISPSSQLTLWITTKSFSCLIWVFVIMFIMWPRKFKLFKSQDDDNELLNEDSDES